MGASVPFALMAQSGPSNRTPGPVEEARLTSSLRKYIRAAGDRLLKPGKERVHSIGSIETGSGANANFEWFKEYPGKLKINGLGKDLVFDLQKVNSNQLDDLDEDLLEGLSSDTDDAFFGEWIKGNRGRLLGAGFAVQGATGFGSSVDIYEMAMPVAARKVSGVSVKHFMFDSQTGYLHKVAYSKYNNGVKTSVVTELRDYILADGVPVARRIYRGANGQRRYQIQVSQVALVAKANDNLFGTAK